MKIKVTYLLFFLLFVSFFNLDVHAKEKNSSKPKNEKVDFNRSVGRLSNRRSMGNKYAIVDGSFIDASLKATKSAQEHFNIAMGAMDSRDWKTAIDNFRIVAYNFPDTRIGKDSRFHLGVIYYRQGELEFANNAFTTYLEIHDSPDYFEEAIQYKYHIAEQFRNGAKRRIFGSKQLPAWLSGENLAIEIYEEVITVMPTHEMACKSLFAKAALLRKMRDYRESVECYRMVIGRFPKHELAPESYLAIARLYYEQSQSEFQNPDILAFAQINLRSFKAHFPREERIAEAEKYVKDIMEVYANGLYETGLFYERTCHPKASILYYHKAITQFPDTAVAKRCFQRISSLCPGYKPESSEEKESEKLSALAR